MTLTNSHWLANHELGAVKAALAAGATLMRLLTLCATELDAGLVTYHTLATINTPSLSTPCSPSVQQNSTQVRSFDTPSQPTTHVHPISTHLLNTFLNPSYLPILTTSSTLYPHYPFCTIDLTGDLSGAKRRASRTGS